MNSIKKIWFRLFAVCLVLTLANCANQQTIDTEEALYDELAADVVATAAVEEDMQTASIEGEESFSLLGSSDEGDNSLLMGSEEVASAEEQVPDSNLVPGADGFAVLAEPTSPADQAMAEFEQSMSGEATEEKEEFVTLGLAPVSGDPAVVAQPQSEPTQEEVMPTLASQQTQAMEVATTQEVITRKPRIAAKAPKVSKEAIQANGDKLNRYYFVRSGDTAKSIANLLYGSEDRSADIQKWNSSIKAGDVLYYADASNKEDGMKSFYEQRFVDPEEYVIRKGDSLSGIAQQVYGNNRSWREIASANTISRPDRIKVGQRLGLYPSDLSPYKFQAPKREVAKAESLAAAPAPTQSQSGLSDTASLLGADIDNVAKSQIIEKKYEPKKKTAKKKGKKAAQASGGLTDFFSRNLLVIFIGLGVLAMALFGYLLLNPKSEDSF